MRAGCTAMTQRPQERHTALRRLPRGAIHHGMQPALQRTNIQVRGVGQAGCCGARRGALHHRVEPALQRVDVQVGGVGQAGVAHGEQAAVGGVQHHSEEGGAVGVDGDDNLVPLVLVLQRRVLDDLRVHNPTLLTILDHLRMRTPAWGC